MKIKHILLVFALIVFSIATRYIHVEGLPQFNAVMATAAFMGFVIRDTKWAVAAALLMMIVSDMLLGSYGVMSTLFNYGGIIALVLMTSQMREYTIKNTAISSLLGPVLFFVISNMGVFLFGQPQMYPHTLAGLIDCYLMAVPFAKGTLLGTALYSTLYYVAYHKALAPRLALERVRSK